MQRYGDFRIPEITQMGHSAYHDCGILSNTYLIITRVHSGKRRYAITTSSTIISTKPIANPMVLRFVCRPVEASGMSSSTYLDQEKLTGGCKKLFYPLSIFLKNVYLCGN